jgi:hypothetical protein
LKSLRVPQFGQQCVRPRVRIWPLVTFMGEADTEEVWEEGKKKGTPVNGVPWSQQREAGPY